MTSIITPWSSSCFRPLTTTTATTPSTPLTLIGTPPPCIAYSPALLPSPYFSRKAISSPPNLQCMYQVLQPHLRTVFLFLATHMSLSGITPECVQVWKRIWFWLASAISITTGVGKARRRLRSAEPSSHASLVVKWPKVSDLSMRAIDSSLRRQISLSSATVKTHSHLVSEPRLALRHPSLVLPGTT